MLQLYADNLKCVSNDPAVLLRAARFTTGYVSLVGQELAPSKCLLMSTSKVARKDVRDWILSHEWLFSGDWLLSHGALSVMILLFEVGQPHFLLGLG